MSLPSLTFNYVPSIGCIKCINDSYPIPAIFIATLLYWNNLFVWSIIPPRVNDLFHEQGPCLTARPWSTCVLYENSDPRNPTCEVWPLRPTGHLPPYPPSRSGPGPRHHHNRSSYRESQWCGPRANRKGSEAKLHTRPPLPRAASILPASRSLTLRTPNSPRTTRVRISSTA